MSEKFDWRPATRKDIGRLARFADRFSDDWSYGLLYDTEDELFLCVQQEDDEGEYFNICEVQEVNGNG